MGALFSVGIFDSHHLRVMLQSNVRQFNGVVLAKFNSLSSLFFVSNVFTFCVGSG